MLGSLINQRIGRYEILALLGRGGMAAVYRAHDTRLQRDIALKVLYPQFSDDQTLLERFKREAITAAGLEHPHIVPVYDVGEQDGVVYIAMKLVAGRSFADLLRERGTLEPAELATILGPVAAALDYAHARNVVHRDIKPANILLAPGEDGSEKWHVLLSDFGIAKSLDTPGLTTTGALIGTPEYMAPEQIGGRRVDGRADVYSLGMVAFRALTGRPAFEGNTQEVLMAHLYGKPPLPSAINARLNPALDAVLLRALAREPEQRYQSAGAFMHDLTGRLTPHATPLPQPVGTHEQPTRLNEALALQQRQEARRTAPPATLPSLDDHDHARRTGYAPGAGQLRLDPATATRRADRRTAGAPVAALLLSAAALLVALVAIFFVANNARGRDGLPTIPLPASATPAAVVAAATTTATPTTTPAPTATPTTSSELSPTGEPSPTSEATPTTVSEPTAVPRPTVITAVVTVPPIVVTATTAPPPPPTATPPPPPTTTPTREPTVTATPEPPTATLTPCSVPATRGFGKLYNEHPELRERLGCPTTEELTGVATQQFFAGGTMYYWQPGELIYVFLDLNRGSVRVFTKPEVEQLPIPTQENPPGGFGRIYYGIPTIRDRLGEILSPMLLLEPYGVIQRYEGGVMLFTPAYRSDGKNIFVVYNDGSFERYRDTFPD